METSFLYWSLTAAVILFFSWLTMRNVRSRKGQGVYLCDDCQFNNPSDCLKGSRPQAVVCTSYRPVKAQIEFGVGENAEDVVNEIGEDKRS